MVESTVMIRSALMVVMIIISILLATVILLQKKGSGVGAVFGGVSEAYRTRRGAEKILHYTTILLAFLFTCVSIVLLLI